MKIIAYIISALVLAITGAGFGLLAYGLRWYKTLVLPAMTPPAWLSLTVWTLMYALTGLSALLVLQSARVHSRLVTHKDPRSSQHLRKASTPADPLRGLAHSAHPLPYTHL